MSTLACPYCGKEFTPRNSRQKTCGSDECKKAYQRARKQSRRQTDEYKAYERARKQTEEYKANKRANERARRQTEEHKAYMRAYRQTEEYKAYERAYQQTDEYKAYKRAYQRAVRTAEALGIPPLVFAAMKIMSQLQEPNHDSSQRTA